eukprot:TRINITY_DN29210_c0_g2_i1.p1 TRINITY_DN29210_c0_g2~~TRINITY_DN29210_c0_g2_i1.p1  ORF type:complete len:1115 (+),score=255.03 TRINITY_DN29210_c0_g2_i1:88-3345(+)
MRFAAIGILAIASAHPLAPVTRDHRDDPVPAGVQLLSGRKVHLKEEFVHDCIHDRIMRGATGPSRVNVSYAQDGRDRSRRGAALARQPMRIKWFWGESNGCSPASGNPDKNCYCEYNGDTVPTFENSVQRCTQDQVMTTKLKNYLDDIMKDAVAWLSAALHVDPVVGNLKTGEKICGGYVCNPPEAPYCGRSSWNDVGIRTPQSHQTTGVPDVDYIVYVSAVPTQGNTVAWALTCMSDQRDRPTAAHVNFGPTRVDPSTPKTAIKYRNYVATAVHEMMHALGFSSGHWKGKDYWFEAHCAAQGTTKCKPTITVNERGQTGITKMATPEVMKKVREYSGCPTLNGAEIEQEGGSGTAGSHWEKRVFGNEGMTGVKGTHEAEWSAMTLAYFYDTGHYDVDYSMTALDFFWGKGKGCSFWLDKCNEITPASAAAPEYCFPSDPAKEEIGCDYHFMSTGKCGVSQFGGCVPSEFQYFPGKCNFGGSQNSLTDMCPTMTGYSNTECTDPADGRTSQPLDTNLGQSRKSNSRCFKANILETAERYTIPLSELRCFEVECNAACTAYDIVLQGSGGPERLTCTAAGAPKTPTGWASRWKNAADGSAPSVECWAPSEICGPSARAKLGNTCGGAPPSASPSAAPSASPVASPTKAPRAAPSAAPAAAPTAAPVSDPTAAPAAAPTAAPVAPPTSSPEAAPTKQPLRAAAPTQAPAAPSAAPSASPVEPPSASPVAAARPPSAAPSAAPQAGPTRSPVAAPTKAPLQPSAPTQSPLRPSAQPSLVPSAAPQSGPTAAPARSPTTAPARSPTAAPTRSPTRSPQAGPTSAPAAQPAPPAPAEPTAAPAAPPSIAPTRQPTRSPQDSPSMAPRAARGAGPPTLSPLSPTPGPSSSGVPPTAAPAGPPPGANATGAPRGTSQPSVSPGADRTLAAAEGEEEDDGSLRLWILLVMAGGLVCAACFLAFLFLRRRRASPAQFANVSQAAMDPTAKYTEMVAPRQPSTAVDPSASVSASLSATASMSAARMPRRGSRLIMITAEPLRDQAGASSGRQPTDLLQPPSRSPRSPRSPRTPASPGQQPPSFSAVSQDDGLHLV